MNPCETCERNCKEPCWKVDRGLLVEPHSDIDASSYVFGHMLLYALRFALGRTKYVPFEVADFIYPLVPKIDTQALYCMEFEIAAAMKHGHDIKSNEAVEWERLLGKIGVELNERRRQHE